MINISPLSDGFGFLIEANPGDKLIDINMQPYFEAFNTPAGGALLFRGFEGSIADFKEITNRHGKDFMVANTNLDERSYPDSDLSLATVNHGNYAIDFHTETNIPYSADMFWMYCVRPAADRGRTGIVDGVKILKELTTPTRQHFQENGGYWPIDNVPPQQWQLFFPNQNAQQVTQLLNSLPGVYDVKFDAFQNLSFRFDQTPIQRAKFCNSEVFIARLLDWPEHVLKRDGQIYGKHIIKEVNQAAHKHAIWLDWQPGDFMVLNNTRALHAREAFEDDNRNILVRYSNLADHVYA